MFHKGGGVFKHLPGGRASIVHVAPLSPPPAEPATLFYSSPLAVKVEQRGAREGEVTSSC